MSFPGLSSLLCACIHFHPGKETAHTPEPREAATGRARLPIPVCAHFSLKVGAEQKSARID